MRDIQYTIFGKIVQSLYERPLANGAHLIITGGEPLLQQDSNWRWLVKALDIKSPIEIETNGDHTAKPVFAKTGKLLERIAQIKQ